MRYVPQSHVLSNFIIHSFEVPLLHRVGGNRKRNVDQKLIETVFSAAICRPTSDKWQSKTLFLSIFDPRSSIVDNVFDCRLTGVITQLEIREQRSSSYFSQNCLPLTQALQRLYQRGSFQQQSFAIFHQVETEIIITQNNDL